MPIFHKDPKATWCHEHLVWECWWIDGLGQEVGSVPLKSCHSPVLSEEEPWCTDHVPSVKSS